jgi:hypothetical protein
VDYRPESNAVILLCGSHTKVRTHTRRIGKGKETQNLNVVECSLYRSEYSNLKLAEATMGMGPGSSAEVQ